MGEASNGILVALTGHPDGTVIAVYAQPRAGRTSVVGLHDGMVKVALRAPPVDGKANKELLRFVASHLGLPRRDICILTGETGRRKRVLITGVDVSWVADRLA